MSYRRRAVGMNARPLGIIVEYLAPHLRRRNVSKPTWQKRPAHPTFVETAILWFTPISKVKEKHTTLSQWIAFDEVIQLFKLN
jgi:hypothetical protein